MSEFLVNLARRSAGVLAPLGSPAAALAPAPAGAAVTAAPPIPDGAEGGPSDGAAAEPLAEIVTLTGGSADERRAHDDRDPRVAPAVAPVVQSRDTPGAVASRRAPAPGGERSPGAPRPARTSSQEPAHDVMPGDIETARHRSRPSSPARPVSDATRVVETAPVPATQSRSPGIPPAPAPTPRSAAPAVPAAPSPAVAPQPRAPSVPAVDHSGAEDNAPRRRSARPPGPPLSERQPATVAPDDESPSAPPRPPLVPSVAAEALAAPSGVTSPDRRQPEPRPVQVRIGTIEIRAAAPAPPPAPAAPAPVPATGFDDYARLRRYAGWPRR